jgi:hypothetical protein
MGLFLNRKEMTVITLIHSSAVPPVRGAARSLHPVLTVNAKNGGM